MSDIVERLRNHALPDPNDEREVMHAPLLREAADEIERLRDWEARAVRSMDAASRAAGVECCDLVPQAIERLRAELADANRRAQYWKDEHIAGNVEIERLRAENADWQRRAVVWLASSEAAKQLDGYREMAQLAADAENRRDDALSELAAAKALLREALEITPFGDKYADYINDRIRAALGQDKS